MSKRSVFVAALIVPALVASFASAAPKKKKPKPKHPAPAAAPAPAAPAPAPAAPDPVLDAKPSTTALQRVEANMAGWSPKEAPPPVISHTADAPASSAALTSASLSSGSPRATTSEPDVAAPRAARGSATGEGFSVAPLADYGTSKVYGVGVGGRLGYTTSSRIYLGGTFVYHFGGSNGPLSYAFYYVGPEAGYNVPLGPVVLRPYVGGGFGSLRTSYTGQGLIPGGGGAGLADTYHGKSQSAVIWPGATLLVPMGSAFALGVDVRVLFAPGQDATTGTLANNGALSFAGAGATSTPSSTAVAAGATASYRF